MEHLDGIIEVYGIFMEHKTEKHLVPVLSGF